MVRNGEALIRCANNPFHVLKWSSATGLRRIDVVVMVMRMMVMVMMLVRFGSFGPVCRGESPRAVIIALTILLLEFSPTAFGALASRIRTRFWGQVLRVLPLGQAGICKRHGSRYDGA